MLHRLDVTTQIGGDGTYDPSAFIEAKGFKGMPESEMRTAVRKQYPENMTLKECILMSDELGKLGLEMTAYGGTAVENIFDALSINIGGSALYGTDMADELMKTLQNEK